MKHLRKILLTLILIPLLGGFSSKAQNLLPNGGFENDLTNWWTQADAGTNAVFSVNTDDKHEGIKALKVAVITPGANAWNVQAVNDAWASVTGKEYTLTFWAKAEANGSVFKAIVQMGAFYTEKVFTLNNTWQQYSWTFNAGADNLQLKFHFPFSGTFYLDGFNIPTEITEPPLQNELVKNGGFEEGTGNTFTNWWTAAGGGSTATFTASTDVAQGSRALKAEVIAAGNNPWDVQAVNDISWGAVAGQSYSLSFWAKANSSGGSFKVIQQNDESYAERVVPVTNTWQRYEWVFTAASDALLLKFHFPDVGTYFIDRVSIPAPVVPAESELLSNGGFESGSGNSFTGWWSAAGGGATATFTATNEVVAGSRALKVDVTTPGANAWNVQVVNDIPWGSVTGQIYKMSFWAKAATAGSSFKVVQQKDPAYAERVFSLTTTWQKYEWEFTAQADGLSLKFHFPNAGTFYIDQVSIPGSDSNEPIPPFDPSGLKPIAEGQFKFLGSAHSSSQSPFFANYWNQVTPENGGKWGSVEATRDIMRWAEVDSAYQLAKRNGFPFRFHILVWGNQQPTWMESLPAAEQLEEIKEWYAAVAARYPDIDYLEVVNEPLHDAPTAGSGNYIGALGGSGATGWDWVVNAFKIAREYFPAKTKLVLNEFSITNDASSAQRYVSIINLLKAESLIDVIGIQGHAFSTTVPASVTKTNLDFIASTGLPIMITELDIDGPTDIIQLADYKKIFPVFWEHPSVIGITLWGWRPGLWRNAQKANLVMNNGGEKPAMVWLREYVTNKKPVVGASQTFSVSETASNGTVIGTVIASDADEDVLKGWEITGGTGMSLLRIDTAGRIVLIADSLLDYEVTSGYTLQVVVNDGYTNSNAETITIKVLNENDNAPNVDIISPASNAKINKGESLEVLANAFDADANLRSVSLFVNEVLLRVDSSAPYKWGASTNDKPLKSLSPGIYHIVAVATDKGGLQASDSITVTVLDDIMGANCGVRNGTAVFEINPKYLQNAHKITWWFNGYTKSIKSLTSDNSKVEVSFGQWFNPSDLHVGIAYKKAPYYIDLKKDLTICPATPAPDPQIGLVVYPNPTTGPINISAGKKIAEVVIVNSFGKKVYEKKKVNSKSIDIMIPYHQPSGIYKVMVSYEDCKSEVKTVTLQR